jgi:uncharacterized Rmd1/YagE family protein
MNRCTSVCIAKRFDFEGVEHQFSNLEQANSYRDVLHLEVAGGHAFIFNYGVLVLWGLSQEAERTLHRKVAGYCIAPHPDPIQVAFTYHLDAEQNRIDGNHFSLTSHQPLDLLAVSHALAQSSKLTEFESYALQTIEETIDVAHNLAATGSSRLPRKQLARMRGRLMLMQSDINLNHALLDTPEFFSRYPAMDESYRMVYQHLDIGPRTQMLNHKLNVIPNLLGVLTNEQKFKHTTLLAWIIIWLIALAIGLLLFEDFLELL